MGRIFLERRGHQNLWTVGEGSYGGGGKQLGFCKIIHACD